jgi:preprotein translocase subunit SecG
MGAPKTADFLEKTTWCLAGAIIVLSLISAKYVSYSAGSGTSTQITVPVDNTQAPDMQSPQPTELPQLPAPQQPASETPAQ